MLLPGQLGGQAGRGVGAEGEPQQVAARVDSHQVLHYHPHLTSSSGMSTKLKPLFQVSTVSCAAGSTSVCTPACGGWGDGTCGVGGFSCRARTQPLLRVATPARMQDSRGLKHDCDWCRCQASQQPWGLQQPQPTPAHKATHILQQLLKAADQDACVALPPRRVLGGNQRQLRHLWAKHAADGRHHRLALQGGG